mmetsp:Transcript_18019/g.30696  ORF Transcript_18019/g.30696 Transcript_18019/m.30696 type:complete len:180 (+) Transcript_18019:98-637(+)
MLKGADKILIEGKTIIQTSSVVRGDLAQIQIGVYVIIRENVIIRPCHTKQQGKTKYVKQVFGDNVYIEKDCVINAMKIGNNVHIGRGCIIGHRVIIHDNVKILEHSILPPDTVVPPFTVYGGRPAQFIAELPESIGQIHKEFAQSYYKMFQYQKMPMPQSARQHPGQHISGGQSQRSTQ